MWARKLQPVVVALYILSISFTLIPTIALSQKEDCNAATIIFARGSGQEQNTPQDQLETYKFFDELKSRAPTGLNVDTKELIYPAEGNYIALLGSRLSWVAAGEYKASVEKGVSNLIELLSTESAKCPDQKYILGGYSQGAHVIGDALDKLGDNILSKIAYVALFGDPKFNPHSNAAYGNSFPGAGGILGARQDTFPQVGGISNWCRRYDGICEGNVFKALNFFGTHDEYPSREIPIAANYAAAALKQILGFQLQPINQGKLGEKADVMYVIATTKGMQFPLANIKPRADQIVDATRALADDVQIGLVQYQANTATKICPIKTVKTEVNLTNDTSSFIQVINGLAAQCNTRPGDDTNGALLEAISGQSWRDDAHKLIFLLSDVVGEPPVASADVINAAVTAGINIHSLIRADNPISPSEKPFFQPFSDDTGGQAIYMVENSGQSYPVMDKHLLPFLTSLPGLPIVQLAPTKSTQPGQPVTFNAGGSYDPDGTIVSYDWDFNNDGVTDSTTSQPTSTYIYAVEYEATARVKVMSSDGGTASTATSVSVNYDNPIPSAPSAPGQVSLGLNPDNSALVSWSTRAGSFSLANSAEPESFIIKKVDGEFLGIVSGRTNSVTITDLPSGEPIQVSVAAGNDVGLSPEVLSEQITIPAPDNVVPEVGSAGGDSISGSSSSSVINQLITSYGSLFTAVSDGSLAIHTVENAGEVIKDSADVLANKVFSEAKSRSWLVFGALLAASISLIFVLLRRNHDR